MRHPDFTEGVSARLINKPPTNPEWKPSTLEGVSSNDVQEFFNNPSAEETIELIDPYPGSPKQTYSDYPHALFSLPRELDIEPVVKSYGRDGPQAVIDETLRRWNNKAGVKEKVQDVISRKTVESDRGIVWKGKGPNL